MSNSGVALLEAELHTTPPPTLAVGLPVDAFVDIGLCLRAHIGRRGYGRRHARAGPVILACFEKLILNPIVH